MCTERGGRNGKISIAVYKKINLLFLQKNINQSVESINWIFFFFLHSAYKNETNDEKRLCALHIVDTQ